MNHFKEIKELNEKKQLEQRDKFRFWLPTIISLIVLIVSLLKK